MPALSRDSTLGEEIANSISHGLGLLLAVAGLPILIIAALRSGSTTAVVASTVFGASAILLYLASTLCHAIPHLRKLMGSSFQGIVSANQLHVDVGMRTGWCEAMDTVPGLQPERYAFCRSRQ